MFDSEPTHITVRCKSCHAKMRLARDAAGKRAKCPTCGVIFRVPAKAATEGQPGRAARGPAAKVGLTLRCPQCDARLKVPSESAGRKVKCPKCARTLRVPAAVPPEPEIPEITDDDLLSELGIAKKHASAEERLTTDDILPIAPPQPASPDLPSASLVPQPEQPRGTRSCPCCGKELPAGAKVCVDCGVYLDTGRRIITTQDENLDHIYVVAERTIWLVSWIIWLGVYPIASEAFGLRKPWVVRGIALLTIVVSLGFLGVMWTDAPAQDSLRNLMLWAGDPDASADVLASLDQEFDFNEIDDPEIREVLRTGAAEAVREHLASAGEFHPHQLITHAFLHGGILHLAGNMLFLMVFGARVNALIGNVWTLVLYPVLALIAGVAEMINLASGPPIPMVGASGAVMGLAGIYLVFFPVHKVHMAAWLRWGLIGAFRLSLKLFAVRGFWVVLFYIAFDVVYTVFGLEDETAHWAHLGGFIGGVAIGLILLFSRLVDARGADILSVILGRHARKLVDRPAS